MNLYLKNKKVAIVGPASSLEGTNGGDYIDSFDIVVRVNHAKTNTPKDTGNRTNVIYYDGSYRSYDHLNLDYLVCTYPETEWFFNSRCLEVTKYYSKKFNHKIVNFNIYNKLKFNLSKNNKVRPNSGLVAIVDLLQSDLNKLYITGIDFYRTAYLASHPDYGTTNLDKIKQIFKSGDHGDVHDIDIQFDYFKNELLKDPRIELDKFMKNYLNKT